MNTTVRPRPRGPRAQERVIDDATVEAVMEHGPSFLAIARRHSVNALDADDAFQRSLEILLTKAPTDDVDRLVKWMSVVVKNEAAAIQRREHRFPTEPVDDYEEFVASPLPDPAERCEQLDEHAQRIEALHEASCDETRCLLLRAEGLNYEEIAARTQFTARKVARCLAKGRGKLTGRFADIESGSACETIGPLLSRMADGDVAAAREARPHLRHCARCRVTLREYRSAPHQLSAALPLLGVVTAGSGNGNELVAAIHQASGWLAERIGAHVSAFQHWLETAPMKKSAAVIAASTALVGGGTVAGHSVGVIGGDPIVAAAGRSVVSIGDAATEALAPAFPATAPAPTPAGVALDERHLPRRTKRTSERQKPPANPGQLEPEGSPVRGERSPGNRNSTPDAGAEDTDGAGDLSP